MATRARSLVKSVDIERPCRVMFPPHGSFAQNLSLAFGECYRTEVHQQSQEHTVCQYEVLIPAGSFDKFIRLCSAEAKFWGLKQYTALLGGLVMRVDVKTHAHGK